MEKQRGGMEVRGDCKHFTKGVQGDLTEKATIEEKGREPCRYSKREGVQRLWGRSCCPPACFLSYVRSRDIQEAQAVYVFRNTSGEFYCLLVLPFILHYP